MRRNYFGILIKHSGSGKGQPPLHIKGSLQVGLLALSKGQELCLQEQMDWPALWGNQILTVTRLETHLLMYWDLYTGSGSNKLREFVFKTVQQPSWPSEMQASLGEVGGEDGAGPEGGE